MFKRTQVELPVGPAWRIDYAADWWSGSVYTLRGPKGLYTLECWSDQAADGHWSRVVDDDWQRIAESIRFTDDTSTGSVARSPVVRGGRIERPDDGFAVTFPSDWTVEPVTDQTHQIIFTGLEPSDRTRQRTLLAAGSSDGYCVVVDSNPLAQESPERRSIYVATGSFLAGLAADPDIIGPQSIIEDLPAGPTGHITATDVDGWTLGAYHFTDGDTWAYLDCRSPIAPVDGWRSIAETFEFLPAGE